VASALAFNYFRIQPGQSIIPTEGVEAVAIVIFLAVALLANTRHHRARRSVTDDRFILRCARYVVHVA
jgi:K+-sensing histidine kinase KdpD